jgi:MoxR-like ATPase
MTQAKVNIWMTGEAGSGKSTIAENVAEAMGIPFYTLPCAGDLGKHEVVGYMDAKGEYVSTPFRKAYENGGVFIFEEIDSASAEVVLCVNTALANGGMYFPDGAFIKRHKDFVCLAAANTWGIGASRTYVGRQPMDGASLDRFIQYEVVYDEELELEIAGDRDWARKVQRIRQAVKTSNQRMIISPRASINGAKLLAVGFTESQVLEMTILKGCSDEQRNIIMSAL